MPGPVRGERGAALPLLLAASAGAGASTVEHSAAHRCCVGRTLKVGAPSFTVPPYVKYNSTIGGGYWTGFYPKLLDAVGEELGFDIQFVPIGTQQMMGSPPPLMALLADGTIDAVSLDAHVFKMGVMDLVSTVPWSQSQISALVHMTQTDTGLWRLWLPFTPLLWGTVVGTTFAFAAFMLTFRWSRRFVADPGSPRPTGAAAWGREALRAGYTAWAMLLSGDDYEWKSCPQRTLRLGGLFLVLIITATYTANLAAFFTAPSYNLHGPKDMQTLRTARACVVDKCLADRYRTFAASFIYPQAAEDIILCDAAGTEENLEWCHARLTSGEADVWLHAGVVLHNYLLAHCMANDLAEVHEISFGNSASMFLYMQSTAENRALVWNISTALSHVADGQQMVVLLRNEFGVGQKCGPPGAGADSAKITLESMGGLFIVTGALAGVACVAMVVKVACRAVEPAGDDWAGAREPAPAAPPPAGHAEGAVDASGAMTAVSGGPAQSQIYPDMDYRYDNRGIASCVAVQS